jgi:hypothetical protein
MKSISDSNKITELFFIKKYWGGGENFYANKMAKNFLSRLVLKIGSIFSVKIIYFKLIFNLLDDQFELIFNSN